MKNYIIKIVGKLRYLGCLVRGYIRKFQLNVSIGKNLKCENNVEIVTCNGGKVIIGDNNWLLSGCKLLPQGGTITIGNNCSVNPYTILYGHGNLNIGNFVRIATHCVIIPSNHNFCEIDRPIMYQGLTNRGITIEDDVWLGCGVRVLDGVTIAKGCIIGAGSVVTKSTIPYGIYAGVPAKFIKTRTPQPK